MTVDRSARRQALLALLIGVLLATVLPQVVGADPGACDPVGGQSPPVVGGQSPPVVGGESPPVGDHSEPCTPDCDPGTVGGQSPPVGSQSPPCVPECPDGTVGGQSPPVGGQSPPCLPACDPGTIGGQPPTLPPCDTACPYAILAVYSVEAGPHFAYDSTCAAHPQVGIGDVTIEEPARLGALAAMRFPVTLDRALPVPLVLHARLLLPGPAPSPSPYASPADVRADRFNPRIVIPAGRQDAEVTVWVRGDAVAEPSLAVDVLGRPLEYFSVDLFGTSQPVAGPRSQGVGLSVPYATGYIRDSGGTAQLSLGDTAVWEPDAGAVHARVPLVLSEPLDHDVTVRFTTVTGLPAPAAVQPPWSGAATAGLDFGRRAGSARIRAGETTGFIEVRVVGDELDEAIFAEYLHVAVTGVDGATYDAAEGGGIVAIREEDRAA